VTLRLLPQSDNKSAKNVEDVQSNDTVDSQRCLHSECFAAAVVVFVPAKVFAAHDVI